MKLISKNSSQTKKIAAKFAGEILKSRPHRNHARVLALVGDLGAGKTTFVQGFAKALGIRRRMTSPTFLIFRSYKLRIKNYGFLYHVDAYRIKKISELKTIYFDKVLDNPKNIVLIEWADRIKKILPKDAIWVDFRHGRKETERFITY